MACTIHACRTSLDVHVLAGAKETCSMYVLHFSIKTTFGCVGCYVYETHSLVRVELPLADDSLLSEYKEILEIFTSFHSPRTCERRT